MQGTIPEWNRILSSRIQIQKMGRIPFLRSLFGFANWTRLVSLLIGVVDSFTLGISERERFNFAIHFLGHSCPNLGAVSIVIPLKPIQRIWPELNSALVLLKISVLFFRGSELPESLKSDCMT